MLDSQIAEQLIQNGGVVTNGEFVYLPLRITGTGITERINQEGLAYLIDRRLEDFGAKEWLDQYSNIPILLTHPRNEEGECIRADTENGIYVGNTVASFIKGSEIWGIAKLYDKDTIELILARAQNELPISTSPHFISENVKQDGSDVFLEIPKKINHLAIVERGFWDKKSSSPSIDVGDGGIINLEKGEEMQENVDSMERSVVETHASDAEVSNEAKEDEVERVLEGRVADLEEHEAKEAESFEELAQEHENLENKDKGDEMEVDKRELIREILAIASKPDSDFKGGEDEKFETILGKIEKVAYDKSEDGKSDEEQKEEVKADGEEAIKEENDEIKEEKTDQDTMVSGDYCDEDRKRDEILSKFQSLSGYAKFPYVSGRVKAWKVQKDFAKSNLDLVDEEFRGLVDKIDSSVSGLADKMFDSMIKKIEAKQKADIKNSQTNHQSFFSGKFKNV